VHGSISPPVVSQTLLLVQMPSWHESEPVTFAIQTSPVATFLQSIVQQP
jgi:hypothetical protein